MSVAQKSVPGKEETMLERAVRLQIQRLATTKAAVDAPRSPKAAERPVAGQPSP